MQTQLKIANKTILCVDDDEDDRELITNIIKDLDNSFDVVNAANGEEALQLLEKAVAGETDVPCLVVLDINMPIMNGKEVVKKIKQHEELNEIPLVVFTTSTSPSDKAFFKAYGIHVHTKPDNFRSIEKEVKGFLSYCG